MLRLLTFFSFCVFSSANFLRGDSPAHPESKPSSKCTSTTSITLKPIPCSGSTYVTESNIWESFELARFATNTYESDIWAPTFDNAVVTNVGIPLHLLSGEIILSAELHCVNHRKHVDTHSTNQKVLVASESESEQSYKNIWLQLSHVARVTKSTRCSLQVQIYTNSDSVLRFMLDDNEQSYQFGLVQTPSLVPE